jgi:hypothetical protein
LTLTENGKRSFLNITLVDILTTAIHIGIATKTLNLTSNPVSPADLLSKKGWDGNSI